VITQYWFPKFKIPQAFFVEIKFLTNKKMDIVTKGSANLKSFGLYASYIDKTNAESLKAYSFKCGAPTPFDNFMTPMWDWITSLMPLVISLKISKFSGWLPTLSAPSLRYA
jgi:hypothetical protein